MNWVEVAKVALALSLLSSALVCIAGYRYHGVKVPRPKPPNKTDREIRSWERFIKTLRDVEGDPR